MGDETHGGRTTPSSASSGEKNLEIKLLLWRGKYLEYQQLIKYTKHIVSYGSEKVVNITCQNWGGDISHADFVCY